MVSLPSNHVLLPRYSDDRRVRRGAKGQEHRGATCKTEQQKLSASLGASISRGRALTLLPHGFGWKGKVERNREGWKDTALTRGSH